MDDHSSVLLEFAQRIAACHRALRKDINAALRQSRLSDTELLLLCVCRNDDRLSQNEIARRIGATPSQVSPLAERLHCQGWISPERCPSDRRRQYWALTAEGRRRLNETLIAVSAALGPLLPPATLVASLDQYVNDNLQLPRAA